MSDILEKIKTYKLEEVAARKAATPLAEVEAKPKLPLPPVVSPRNWRQQPRQAMP